MSSVKAKNGVRSNPGAARLEETFRRAREEGRAALIPYVTGGDPDLDFTAALVPELVAAGADIVEIGLPYSDPLADGPTIQRSGQRALAGGVTRQGVFDLVSGLRSRGLVAPVVLLAYYNCIFRRGEGRFMSEAAAAGIDGVVTPDLPPEEAGSLRRVADEAGVALVPLAAPTSTDDRLGLIGRHARGFIYCVSVTGVTGARHGLAPSVKPFLARVRRAAGSKVPLALGFGISGPEQARAAAEDADGVIVGSALVDRLEKAVAPEEGLQAAANFVQQMRVAVHGSGPPAAAR